MGAKTLSLTKVTIVHLKATLSINDTMLSVTFFLLSCAIILRECCSAACHQDECLLSTIMAIVVIADCNFAVCHYM
jgi:hypothetical protein